MKKLKTGDVKRLKLNDNCYHGDKWAIVDEEYVETHTARHWARFFKGPHDRIARILSIGPKYVTVRISK